MLSNEVQLPFVIVDTFVSLKMSTIKREFTITKGIHARIDNHSAEHIHNNDRFHYYKIHYYQRGLYYTALISGPQNLEVHEILVLV